MRKVKKLELEVKKLREQLRNQNKQLKVLKDELDERTIVYVPSTSFPKKLSVGRILDDLLVYLKLEIDSNYRHNLLKKVDEK